MRMEKEEETREKEPRSTSWKVSIKLGEENKYSSWGVEAKTGSKNKD